MPYDTQTGKFRAYTEDELKQLRPDWFAPPPDGPIPTTSTGVPDVRSMFPDLKIGGLGPNSFGWPQAPASPVRDSQMDARDPRRPGSFFPEPIPKATTNPFQSPFMNQLFPPTSPVQPPAANPFEAPWQKAAMTAPNPQTPTPQTPTPQAPMPFAQQEFGQTPGTAASMNAALSRFGGGRFGSAQGPMIPGKNDGNKPLSLPQAWERVKQFGGAIDRAVEFGTGISYVDKTLMGADIPKMTAEYTQYYEAAKNVGAAPMDPKAYFAKMGHQNWVNALSAAEAQKMQIDAGARENVLSPGLEQFANTAGSVLGQAAVAGPLGEGAGWLAGKVLNNPLLKKAPAWIQKTIGSITGAAATGGGYETYMQGLQELAYPDQRTFAEHVAQVGETSAYWGAYGAMAKPAEKLMEKVGGSSLLKKPTEFMHGQFPATTEIGKSVIEGGLTGLGVGAGMFGLEYMKSGDVQKSWAALSGEAKSEMQENFAESILHAFMRRGGKMAAPQRDVLDDMYNEVYGNLSSDMKGEWDTVIQYAVGQGHSQQTAKSVLLDYHSQTKDGEIALHQASQKLFAKNFENTVVQAQATEQGDANARVAAQETGHSTAAPKAVQTSPSAQDLMNQAATEEQTRVQQMMAALNGVSGQEAEARKLVDPAGVLEGFNPVAQPAAPAGPVVRPVQQQSSLAQGARQLFDQGETVRIEGKPGLYQVASNQEGKKRKLISPDGSAVEVAPPTLRKFSGFQPGDKVAVQGREGMFTIVNTRDGKTIRMRDPNGSIVDLPASKVQPHFTAPVTAAPAAVTETTATQSAIATAEAPAAPQAAQAPFETVMSPRGIPIPKDASNLSTDQLISFYENLHEQEEDPEKSAELFRLLQDLYSFKLEEDTNAIEGAPEASAKPTPEAGPAEESMTDAIGGSPITLEADEQPVDTTGDPETVWKKMKEKLALSGALSAKFKVKHLNAMKDFAEKHGFQWAERHQELLDRFTAEIQDVKDQKEEAAARKAEREKQVAEWQAKFDAKEAKLVELAKQQPHYDAFRKSMTYDDRTVTLDGEKMDVPSSHTGQTYLRKIFYRAREEIAKAEGRAHYFEVGEAGIYHLAGSTKVTIVENMPHNDVRIRLPDGRVTVADSARIERVDQPASSATSTPTEPEYTSFENAETGKPVKTKMYQGRGATLEEIYGPEAVEEGRAVPILGPGEYYTDTKEDASVYGKDVQEHTVTLQNPFVITSYGQWHTLMGKAGAQHLDSRGPLFYQEPEKIPDATKKLQSYLTAQGHDGVVIRFDQNEKGLRESFGHNQLVVFGGAEVKAETTTEESAQVLQRQFYAVSPNPDEIEAVRRAKPPNVLVSYGTWGEQAGRTKDSLRDFVKKLGIVSKGTRVRHRTVTAGTQTEGWSFGHVEEDGPVNGQIKIKYENGHIETVNADEKLEYLIKVGNRDVYRPFPYKPTLIADNGAFTNFNKGHDSQLYEVMAYFKDALDLSPEEAWHDMQRMLHGDDTMNDFPQTSETTLRALQEQATGDEAEGSEYLHDLYNRVKDGEQLNAQEEANTIGVTAEVVRKYINAANKDKKDSRWPDFFHFMEWLGYNNPVIDYVMAPDILTKGQPFTETVKPRQESNLGQGQAKNNVDGDYIQQLANFTYRVLKEGGYNSIPVFQFMSDIKYMNELIRDGADYIAIATDSSWSLDGRKKERAEYVRNIIKRYGSNVKFHLLGTNDKELIDMIGPGLYSVDGKTWMQNSMIGETGEARVKAGTKSIQDREAEVEARKEISIGYIPGWEKSEGMEAMVGLINGVVWKNAGPFQATHGDEQRVPASWQQDGLQKVHGYAWRKADGETYIVAGDINQKSPAPGKLRRPPTDSDIRDIKDHVSRLMPVSVKDKVDALLREGKREEAANAMKNAIGTQSGNLPENIKKEVVGMYVSYEPKGIKISFYDDSFKDLHMSWLEAVDRYEIQRAIEPFWEIKVTDIESLKDWAVLNAANHVHDKERITQLLRRGQKAETVKFYKQAVGSSGQSLPEPYRMPGDMMNDPKGIHITFNDGTPAINISFEKAVDRFERLMIAAGQGAPQATANDETTGLPSSDDIHKYGSVFAQQFIVQQMKPTATGQEVDRLLRAGKIEAAWTAFKPMLAKLKFRGPDYTFEKKTFTYEPGGSYELGPSNVFSTWVQEVQIGPSIARLQSEDLQEGEKVRMARPVKFADPGGYVSEYRVEDAIVRKRNGVNEYEHANGTKTYGAPDSVIWHEGAAAEKPEQQPPSPNAEQGQSITLWVPDATDPKKPETREVYSDVQSLIKRLRELSDKQLRQIAEAYAITGASKQKPTALPMFIADALARDQFTIPQKGLNEIFQRSMKKIEDTVPEAAYDRIKRMVKKFQDGTVDFRIDKVLFQPIADNKGMTAINYTDLKTDQQYFITLDPAGKTIEAGAGYEMKRDFPKTLAEWTWDNYKRTIMPVGEADWTGWTLHDRTRAKRAEEARKLFDAADWANNKPAMTGNDNDPDFAGPDDANFEAEGDVPTGAVKMKDIPKGTIIMPNLSHSGQVYKVGDVRDSKLGPMLQLINMKVISSTYQQHDAEDWLDHNNKAYVLQEWQPSKPAAEMTKREVIGEFVDHFIQKFHLAGKLDPEGNRNDAIAAFKKAAHGYAVYSDGLIIVADKGHIEMWKNGIILSEEITNIRDLLREFVYKEDTGGSVVTPDKDKQVQEFIPFHPENGDWTEEQRVTMEQMINQALKIKSLPWLAYQNPDDKTITVISVVRPPGTTHFIHLQEVIQRDGNQEHVQFDPTVDERGWEEVYRNKTVDRMIELDEENAGNVKTGEHTPKPPPKAPEPEQQEQPPEKTLRPLSDDPAKVTPEEYAAYVSAARHVIDRLIFHIEQNSMPKNQAGYRKMVGELLGRPPTEDEWSDLLEAAIQEHAVNNIKKVADDMEYSVYDRTKQLIAFGETLEGLMKNAGRSLEKVERQQYSTPIPLSAIASYALNAREGETVKEGSAGTGSLVLPVKTLFGANVQAIELSPRRAAILTALGIEVQNENTFDVKAKADAVIGNPPFRGENVGKGTVAFAGNPPWKGGWGDLGNRFLAWDLRSIPDGGRLVYVVSPNVIDGKQNAEFIHWLEENHTVRALVKIHEGGYESRGTSYGAGIIVVDKGKVGQQSADQPIPLIYGTAENWNGLLDLLKPLGEDGPYGRQEVVSIPGGGRTGGNSSGSTGTGGRGGRSGGGSSGGRHGSGSSSSGNSNVGSRGGSNGVIEPGSAESTAGGNDAVSPGRDADVVEPGQEGVQNGVQPQDQAAGKPNVERVPRKPKEKPSEDVGPDVSGFVGYVPQGGLTGRAHLGEVVETGNLSMIKYPDEIFTDPAYQPHEILLKAEGAAKKLSDVQLETVFLAKYNWAQNFRSLWIADDTGVGKTGSQMAIAADAWHSGEAKRILIVTATDQVATADFMAGNEEFALKLPLTFVNSATHNDFKDDVYDDHQTRENWKPLPVGDGVMVMSKYTFAASQKAIREWLIGSKKGELTSHAVMVLVDEAHEYANVESNRGMALAELYDAFKDRGQFVYSSATGAENLDELQYMYGLGLWGNPEEFGDFKTRLKGFEPSRSTRSSGNQSAMGRAMNNVKNPFEREIPLAMMEQMIRELKGEGQYIGRSLSMEGVTLEALPITLTHEQIGEYNRAVEFISRIADKAEEHNTAQGRGRIMTGVVGYMRRLRGFYAMQAIIQHMKEEIAAGRLDRFVLSGEFKSADANESGPAMLAASIRAINEQEKADGPGGRTIYTTIPEAVDDKSTLLEMLAGNHADYNFQKPVPDLPSPIEMLYQAFGDDKVLIITGDVDKNERPGIVKEFQGGKKKIIFFNSAANTGISLHDTVGNQIGFYHVDYPYNAKAAKQSEGRSNRTGQKTKPVIFYPFIVGSLDTKFVGTLLSRSASMGAMSRGKANKMGDGELDNFEFSGDAAKLAVTRLVPMLDEETRVSMFGEYARTAPVSTGDPDMDAVSNMGWVSSLFGGEVDVKKFINYIMYLDFAAGGKVIEQYGDAYRAAIARIEEIGGVVEKFRTFNGREIDKAEGQNITVRHIETILKPAEEAAYQRRLEAAQAEVATAEEVLAETKRQLLEKIQENFDKQTEKRGEAQANLDKLMQDAREARNEIPNLSDIRDEIERQSRNLNPDNLRVISNEKRAEYEARVAQLQQELADAPKKKEAAEAKYEKISKRLDKAREEGKTADSKYNAAKQWKDYADEGGALLEANLQTIPAYRRASSALESRNSRLDNIKAQIDSNKGATLIEGKIATTGLMVPIRAALRSAAKEHYGSENPPPAATTVELRGYQLQDGTRAVGVVVPIWAEATVLDKLNVRFAYSGENGDMKALMAHIQKGNDVELEGGFTLTWRPRDKVVAIQGMTRGRHVDLYNQLQESTEDFGFIPQSGMFIVRNEAGLGRLVQRFPVKGVGQQDEEGSALATMVPGGVPQGRRRGARQPKTPPTISQTVQQITDTPKVLTPKSARAIADILADGLDTVIYTGRVKRGAEGVYNHLKSKAIAVRERSEDRWRVIGHELGHAFSRTLSRAGDKQELIDLAEALYPNGPNLPNVKKPEEGFAEFFRLWVADPDLAQQHAPKTTALFEKYIASDPVLEPLFAKIRLIVDNDFADGSPTARAVAGSISSEYRVDEKDVLGPQYEVGGKRLPGVRAAERLLFRVADFTIPARDLDAALAEAAKKPGLSLQRLMSIMGDSRSKALLTFTEVPANSKGYHMKGAVLQELYEKGIKDIIAFMGNKKINLASKELKDNPTKETKPLYDKYKKMGAKDAFDALLLAMRVQERYSLHYLNGTAKHQDGTLPLTKDHANEIIAEAKQKYPDAIKSAKALTDRFSDVVLWLTQGEDIITQETADAVKAGSTNYIPFYYVDGKRPNVSGGKFFGRTYKQPIKPFRGQVKPTLDAFQAMMLKLQEVHQAIEYKRVLNLIHEMADTGDPAVKHFMRMLPAQTEAVQIHTEQIVEQIFNKTNIDLSGALQNIDHFKFFTPKQGMDANRRTVLNIRNGKAVEIELAKDFFDAVMAMKPVQVKALGKVIRKLVQTQRFVGLVTLRFIYSTLARDPATVAMQSDQPHKTFRNFLNSLGAVFETQKNKGLHDAFVNSGAALGAYENLLSNMGKNHFGDEILRLPAAGWGKMKVGGKMVWLKVWRSPNELMRILEEGPRLAEFLGVWKHEVGQIADPANPGQNYDADALWELYKKDGTEALPKPLQRHMERILVDAAYKAREVTTNFGLHGETEGIRKYTPTVPFLQGSVQGFYRFIRQARDHPWRTLTTASVTWGALSYLSYAVMNGLLLGDDDEERKRRLQDYYGMSSAMKDKYWFFPIAGMSGVYTAVAKPFEYAIAANVFERYLDARSGEIGTRKMTSDITSLLGTMTNLDVINNVYHIAYDLATNRNSFGGAIVPLGEQGDPKDMRAGPDTSVSATRLSTFMTEIFHSPLKGPSPREVDYAIRGVLGRYGTTALDLSDAAFALGKGESFPSALRATKPVGGPQHWPVLGQILYDRSELGGARIVDKFYSDLKLATTYSNGARDLQKAGSTKLPGWVTERGMDLLRAQPMLDEVSRQLSEMNNAFKFAINDTTKLPSERERFRLQQVYYRQMLAGIPYGKTPVPPSEVTGLTMADAEQMYNSVLASIDGRVSREQRKEGGPTDQWAYFMGLKNESQTSP